MPLLVPHPTHHAHTPLCTNHAPLIPCVSSRFASRLRSLPPSFCSFPLVSIATVPSTAASTATLDVPEGQDQYRSVLCLPFLSVLSILSVLSLFLPLLFAFVPLLLCVGTPFVFLPTGSPLFVFLRPPYSSSRYISSLLPWSPFHQNHSDYQPCLNRIFVSFGGPSSRPRTFSSRFFLFSLCPLVPCIYSVLCSVKSFYR